MDSESNVKRDQLMVFQCGEGVPFGSLCNHFGAKFLVTSESDVRHD